MKIDLVQDMIWALTMAKMDEINTMVKRIAGGDRTIPEEIRVAISESKERKYDYAERLVRHFADPEAMVKIAVVDVSGTLMKRGNMFTRISGGCSTEELHKAIQTQLDDRSVTGIVLDVNSPGGSVYGLVSVAELLFKGNAVKPVVAFADGSLCSGAYWIASACNRIVIAPTTMAGSIGVITTHYDLSKQDEKEGVVRTHVYAGSYKAMGADNAPLDKGSREYLQAMVDAYYGTFIGAVAKYRGLSIEKTLDMADGKIFLGSEAVSVNLVDYVGTLEDAINLAAGRNTNMNLRAVDVNPVNAMTQATAGGTVSPQDVDAGAELERLRSENARLSAEKVESEAKAAQDVLALRTELRKKDFTAALEAGKREFRITPAFADDPNTLGMLLVLDQATIEGRQGTMADWFVEAHVKNAPQILIPGHVASKEAVSGDVGVVDEERLGEEIAAAAERRYSEDDE